ncbi:hypothetical protein NNJEOMEG_01737 [Fundidesulfovibrio magnetotacticus]|uniref:Acyltransferase 3 domain-containing protein n=1 Tax=Fundidesulfovibrio magnetotacticus TaxID=2730080 RepID=A0A6V8LUW3_9BACT|nr:acyltransferase family protein [Fundidesulfovibrio magnetotacticus]GFK93899.1 hypothetical protein NNJEOMEG_01737 [Fundidesulfovibrio magnetotacticus]
MYKIAVGELVSTCSALFRVLATIYIFVFHCNSLYGLSNFGLVDYAFIVFMFVSGYYAVAANVGANEWLVRRLKRIFIPYWIVTPAVLLFNHVFSYKDVGLFESVVLLLGGNFFLSHRLYVVTWFVSVIVVFYVYTYVVVKFASVLTRAVFAVVSLFIFLSLNVPAYLFVSYNVGMLVSVAFRKFDVVGVMVSVSGPVFNLFRGFGVVFNEAQGVSYEFFLVHGGVLLLFCKVLHFGYVQAFLVSFCVSVVFSYAVRYVASCVEGAARNACRGVLTIRRRI